MLPEHIRRFWSGGSDFSGLYISLGVVAGGAAREHYMLPRGPPPSTTWLVHFPFQVVSLGTP